MPRMSGPSMVFYPNYNIGFTPPSLSQAPTPTWNKSSYLSRNNRHDEMTACVPRFSIALTEGWLPWLIIDVIGGKSFIVNTGGFCQLPATGMPNYLAKYSQRTLAKSDSVLFQTLDQHWTSVGFITNRVTFFKHINCSCVQLHGLLPTLDMQVAKKLFFNKQESFQSNF